MITDGRVAKKTKKNVKVRFSLNLQLCLVVRGLAETRVLGHGVAQQRGLEQGHLREAAKKAVFY